MAAITITDKERALNHFRHWYRSHKESAEHYKINGNGKAQNYHENQMANLKWLAALINSLETEAGNDCPF